MFRFVGAFGFEPKLLTPEASGLPLSHTPLFGFFLKTHIYSKSKKEKILYSKTLSVTYYLHIYT